MQQLQQDSF